jgi:CheY-like chemotaxis protein
MQRELEQEGAIVIGPAPSVEKALRLIAGEPRLDAAILDVNLGDEKSFPVAQALQLRLIPFVFATGYNAEGVPSEWRHVTVLEKPVQITAAARMLAAGSTQ